jgi:hypothetical protein
VPRDPYVALWSRLDRFRPAALAEPIADRRAVRLTLLRGTLHLVTARDALALRPVLQPAIRRGVYGQGPFRRAFESVDMDELLELFRGLLEGRPRTRADLARAAAERWPDADASSLGYGLYLLPTVQVTPRGVWGRAGRSAFTTLESWLGRPTERDGSPDEMVLRYLAAFGPASPADVQSWSGLQGMREVLERLRPRLRTVRDERGRELFDVPGAPLPNPDTPAPVRFLPEYDNVLLGHADRSRVVSPDVTGWTDVGWGFVLADGFTAARWKLEREGDRAVLRVEPFRTLRRTQKAEVSEEGQRLLAFLAEDAGPRDVRIAARA